MTCSIRSVFDTLPRRVYRTPRRHHGWVVLIVILGFLFPPLAVAARFGIGKDFFINLVLTICGYIPGHGHNFFIQNIRDNTNAKRTPKWAIRYGLVDDSHAKRKAKKRQWTGRYNDTLPERTQYDDEGNAIRYDSHHRFEDGVDPARAGQSDPRRGANDSTLVDEDSYYAQRGDGDSVNSDPYSLRRSRSNASSRYGSAGASGETERRQARSKSKARAMFGKKKGGDRHAKSDLVMGDGVSGNGTGWGDDDSSLQGGRAGDPHRHRDPLFDNDDGPEDADARYRPGRGGSSMGSSKQLPGTPAGGGYGNGIPDRRRGSSSASSQNRPNDGLDHAF